MENQKNNIDILALIEKHGVAQTDNRRIYSLLKDEFKYLEDMGTTEVDVENTGVNNFMTSMLGLMKLEYPSIDITHLHSDRDLPNIILRAREYNVLMPDDAYELFTCYDPNTLGKLIMRDSPVPTKLMEIRIKPEEPFYSVPVDDMLVENCTKGYRPKKILKLLDYFNLKESDDLSKIEQITPDIMKLITILNEASVDTERIFTINELLYFEDEYGVKRIGGLSKWETIAIFEYEYPTMQGTSRAKLFDYDISKFRAKNRKVDTTTMFYTLLTREESRKREFGGSALMYVYNKRYSLFSDKHISLGISKQKIIETNLYDITGPQALEMNISNIGLLSKSRELYHDIKEGGIVTSEIRY